MYISYENGTVPANTTSWNRFSTCVEQTRETRIFI